MNRGELRAAIDDLTRTAAGIGEAIGMLNAGVAAHPAEVSACAAMLRAHRGWLLEQVELLSAKLRTYEDRMKEAAIEGRIASMRVSLPVFPIGVVNTEVRV